MHALMMCQKLCHVLSNPSFFTMIISITVQHFQFPSEISKYLYYSTEYNCLKLHKVQLYVNMWKIGVA